MLKRWMSLIVVVVALFSWGCADPGTGDSDGGTEQSEVDDGDSGEEGDGHDHDDE